jgi:NAD(P)-dependent dehydrogenase (short-subunit alcohol dehydrogenase family)/acyl carrier protein
MDAQHPMSPQSADGSTKKDKAAVEAPSNRSPVIPDASRVADQTVDEAGNQDTAATSHPMPSLSLPSTKMADTLLGVVSELTGYPVEMIDLDMDIEADLGIDSIKRVEILSTLEEKIPDLPLIPPDDLGSLKTLNQILAFLSEKTGIFDSVPIPEAEEPSHKLPANEQAMSGSPKADELRNRVLQVVSELTGYPVEIIGADMDMEADLGIDSIKRVEILSILEEKYADLPVVPPETLGSLKTLEEIVAVLAGANVENHKAGMDVAAPASAEETPCGHRHPQTTIDLSQIDRHRVTVVEQTPLESKPITLAADRKVFITDDKSGLSKAIADELSEYEINSVLISPDILEYKSELPAAAGLLLVCGPDTDLGSEDIKNAFGLAKHVAPALKDAAKNGGALFGAVVRLDGGFGFRTGAIRDPFQGAFAGLVKTAALEWESVTCRVIDVAPSWHDPYAAAKAIVPELLGDDKPATVEVGLDAGGRYALTLDPISYAANPEIDLALETDSVMVVSGGARGITAANVLALTRHCEPTIVLLGRSAAPTDEPSWLAGLQDEARIKAAILQHEFSHPTPSPAELETVYRRYLANREIANNLDAFKRQNIAAHYFCVDIRDDARVKEILNRVRRQYGPIRALIHGAGVVEDRLIEEKSTAQFGTVFDTKVIGLQSLLAAVGNDELRYLVLYSSVAARFGNRGQADYAMANEVLNKMASREAARRPACKVVSINWGPWDGGMVTTALKREFKRRGIDLISMDTGAQCLAAEMSNPDHRLVEVIVGQALGAAKPVIRRASDAPSTGASTRLNPPDQSLFISFQRDVDLDRYPIVGDHQLNGKPVIPLALITEWFGHGALHENPGLYLHGIDDMRVLQGIKIEADKRQIRLLAGKAKKSDDFFKVALELRNGHRNGTDIVHSKATAILTDTVVHPPQYGPTLPDTFSPYPRDIQEVYDKILFHGQLLHGIQRILHLDQNGIIAFVAAAPPPSAWLKEPLRNTWITDPLILDSAFQMASVWCYEHMGMVSLPSYCGSYRQYTRRFPSEGVTAVLEVDNTRRNKMTGRFTFLDDEQKVLAQLSGYEAVVDPSLYRAFKPDLVVNA